MARTQATRRVTRKGSKQLIDEERASQVASPTIPPESEGEDNEGEDNGPGRSPFFTPEVMRGVREAQKKRTKMSPEEISIEIDKTRLSLGLIPMADLQQMKADHKRSAERDKQRADAKSSSASDPLEIDNDDGVEQHLTICHQPGHGYHIYLISFDCLNYLY